MSKHGTKSLDPSTPVAPRATPRPERDPLDALGHEMLALFRGPLAEVRFPDVDRAILEAEADAVWRAQLDVEAGERALEEARAHGRDANASFLRAAGRALAYARIFAAGQPALEAVLASPLLAVPSTLPRPGVPIDVRDSAGDGRKRRGRPKKDHSTADLLPMAEGPVITEEPIASPSTRGSDPMALDATAMEPIAAE